MASPPRRSTSTAVVDRLAVDRRVVLFDLLGYGLSEKPDLSYRLALQADIAVALVGRLGLDHLALLTHDVGDTVGGELLARQLEGILGRRPSPNGRSPTAVSTWTSPISAPGQLFLLGLPDEKLPDDAPIDQATVMAGVDGHLQPGPPSTMTSCQPSGR